MRENIYSWYTCACYKTCLLYIRAYIVDLANVGCKIQDKEKWVEVSKF